MAWSQGRGGRVLCELLHVVGSIRRERLQQLWNARRYCRTESTSCHMEGFEWFDIVCGLRELRVGRLGREKKSHDRLV
jgi:hypothetical protein